MRLFDKAAAKELRIATSQYNQKIIDSINDTVPADNYLIMNGIISIGRKEDTIKLLNKIKANKIIMSKDSKYLENKDDWLTAVNLICQTDGSHKFMMGGEECSLVYLAGLQYLPKYLPLKNIYIAAPNSMIDIDDVYKKPLLNISLNAWDYVPLELGEQIPQLIDDMELFNSMEENKEEKF